MQPPKPELKAIIVCDNIIVDKRSNKKSLIGLFDRIYIHRFPTTYRPVYVYVAFSDASGDYRFHLEFYSLTENKLLVKSSPVGPIHYPDRFKLNDIIMELPPLPFPGEGDYEMRVFANDQILGQRTINVVQRR